MRALLLVTAPILVMGALVACTLPNAPSKINVDGMRRWAIQHADETCIVVDRYYPQYNAWSKVGQLVPTATVTPAMEVAAISYCNPDE